MHEERTMQYQFFLERYIRNTKEPRYRKQRHLKRFYFEIILEKNRRRYQDTISSQYIYYIHFVSINPFNLRHVLAVISAEQGVYELKKITAHFTAHMSNMSS